MDNPAQVPGAAAEAPKQQKPAKPNTSSPLEVEASGTAATGKEGGAGQGQGDNTGGSNCSPSMASMVAFVKFLSTAIGFGVFLLPSFIADIGWGLGAFYLSLVTLLMVGLPQVLEEALAYASDLRAASRNCRFLEYQVWGDAETLSEKEIFDMTGIPFPRDRSAQLPHYVSFLGVTLPRLFGKVMPCKSCKPAETYPHKNVQVLVFKNDEDLYAFKVNWTRAKRLASDREKAGDAELSGESAADSAAAAPTFLDLGCYDHSSGRAPPAVRKLDVKAVLEKRDIVRKHEIDFSSAQVVLQDGAPMPLDDDFGGDHDGTGHSPVMEDALEPLGGGAVMGFRVMNILLLFFVYILYIPLVNDCGVIEMINKAMRPLGDPDTAFQEKGSWVMVQGDEKVNVPVESMIVTCLVTADNATSALSFFDDAGRAFEEYMASNTMISQHCPNAKAVGEKENIYVEYLGVNMNNFSTFHSGDPDKKLVIISAAKATSAQQITALLHKNLMALVMAAIQAVYFSWLWGKKGAFGKYMPWLARFVPKSWLWAEKGTGRTQGMCDNVGACVALIGVLLLGFGFLKVAWTTDQTKLPKELQWENGGNVDNKPGFWWRGSFDLEKVGTLYQFFTLYTVAGILTPVRSEVAQNLSNNPGAASKALSRAWYVMLLVVLVFYMVVVVKGHNTWGRGVQGNVLDVIKFTHQENYVVTSTAIGAALNLIFSGVLLNASTFKGIRNLVLSQNKQVWNQRWKSCPCGVWIWAVVFTTVMPVVSALLLPKSWISKGSMMMCAIALPFLQGLFCLLAVVANLKALKLQYRSLGSHRRRKWMCPCDKRVEDGAELPMPSCTPDCITTSRCCQDRSCSCFFFWYMLLLCVVAMIVGLYKAVKGLTEADVQGTSPLELESWTGTPAVERRLTAIMAAIDAEGPGGLLGARLRGSLIGF